MHRQILRSLANSEDTIEAAERQLGDATTNEQALVRMFVDTMCAEPPTPFDAWMRTSARCLLQIIATKLPTCSPFLGFLVSSPGTAPADRAF